MGIICRHFLLLSFLTFLQLFSYGQKQTINPCLPAMTLKERDSITTPERGQMIFNTSTGCVNIYGKDEWREFCETADDRFVEGMVRYDTLSGKVSYFDGNNWIPFEEFKDRMKNRSKSPTSLAATPVTVKKENANSEKEVDPKSESSIESTISPTDCSKEPTEANAGKDIVSLKEIQLEANKPVHGIGQWIIHDGDRAEFKNPNDPFTIFTGKRGFTYTLRWQIATECDTTFDDIKVRIRFPCDPEPSLSLAGIDQFHVERCFLNANYPETGEGSWKIMQGVGGRVKEPTNPKSELIGKEGETYILRWMIRTKCGFTQDDVKITFKPPCKPKPSKALAGKDQLDVDTCFLSANTPEFGEGRWVIISGKNGKFDNRFSASTYFTGISEGTYKLKWEITTECGTSSDTVVVRFNKRCPEFVVDERDGKKYGVFKLKDQCWITKNLDYRDVDYYCYDDDQKYCDRFGALYKWETAVGRNSTSKDDVCPDGWHVPSDEEWDDFNNLVKSRGETMKLSDNDGFNIQYGGMRYENGSFSNKNQYAFFWSSSKNKDKAWNRYYSTGSQKGIHFSANIENGFSVRCIQD